MIRTFIAVELDPHLQQAIGGAQDSLKDELQRLAPGVRLHWVRVEAIHLTLKFLGDIEESQVGGILQALEMVGHDHVPFSIDVKGLGVFPDLRAPRVVWMGLSGHADRLVRLAGAIDVALTSLGFQAEQKPYLPHLTLARVKERARDIGKALADSGVTRESKLMGTLSVQAVALMKSELTPSGSIYTRLGLATLGIA
jgi:2'-5' RNA ligase